ncbi:alpha/beta fold hydrolase [Occultella gossypii]|uniref:Alpha/beta hydrolase n=1 Tax=Occultella gossypii TaxID=2800820 RepID=A0ABS7SF98_9MICO|nr:alpha/beta hydrolase [Occultella gossypii]MBZ2197933.1 alpha/beta hydrolase [Occultella gossypii]
MSTTLTSGANDLVAFDRRGDGPAIVFVAGAGPFRAIDPWTTETAERAAAAGLTTIVYDRLGRGESVAAGVIDLDRELAAIAALIDEVGGSAVLCGHSSGCTIALAAAVRGLPVDGLMLWEAPIGGQAGGAAAWAAEVLRRIDGGDLEGALTHYMKDMPPEWLDGARRSPMWEAMVAGVVSYVADAQSLAWIESEPLPDLLAGIRVPVAFLTGTHTFPMMLDAARAVVAAIPGATHASIDGKDHAWNPAAMADEAVRFVTGRTRRDGPPLLA